MYICIFSYSAIWDILIASSAVKVNILGQCQIKSYFMQSVHLGAKPLEAHSLCNTLSDYKMRVSLMNVFGLSSSEAPLTDPFTAGLRLSLPRIIGYFM
jgi:hypothetical protein